MVVFTLIRNSIWRWLLIAILILAVFGLDPRLARAAAPAADTPLPAGFRYPSLFPPAPTVGAATRRIVVDLSEQQLIAYEGDTPIRAFPASTGDAAHPTLVGHFTIQQKYERIDLIGRDYYYHDVPYVMMFAKPFYIHAAPWRAEFGTPVSRGCVTLATTDAAWLFAWADVGTVVYIHW